MSEEINNMQPKRKICKASLWSLLLCVLTIFISYIWTNVNIFIEVFVLCLFIFYFSLAIVGIVKVKRSDGKLKGYSYAIVGLILAIVMSYSTIGDIYMTCVFRKEVVKHINEKRNGSFMEEQEAFRIWKSDVNNPEKQARAAFVILKHMEDKEEFLTLGNVIQVLKGDFILLDEVGYSFDENGNLMSDEMRNQILFNDKKVTVGFTVMGSVDRVLYETTEEMRTGWSAWSWPQNISKFKSTPVVTGIFEDDVAESKLKQAAKKLIGKYRTEEEWYNFIQRLDTPSWPDLHQLPIITKTNGKRCSAKFYLVDGITDKIAKVFYHIKGKHIYYCDTWWLFNNDVWELISTENAKNIIDDYNINLKDERKKND